MIAFIVLVCAVAVLLSALSHGRRNAIKNEVLFCECRIYGKFRDSEVSIDDVAFRIIE